MTQEQIWAHTDMADPYEHYLATDNEYWDFVYETGRCAEVLKTEFKSLEADNEDANEVLNQLSSWSRDSMFDAYDKKMKPREAFNDWWWSKHDIADYEEVTA